MHPSLLLHEPLRRGPGASLAHFHPLGVAGEGSSPRSLPVLPMSPPVSLAV